MKENNKKTKKYRASDFLNLYLDFNSLVPDTRDWKLGKLKNNPPRYYRLKQLNSLLQAFDIGTNLLRDFKEFKFLNKRNDNTLLEKEMQKFAKTDPRAKHEVELGMDSVCTLPAIDNFLRLAENVWELKRFNSGHLLSGPLYLRYVTRKVNIFFDSIDFTEITTLICNSIDPKDLVFTETELIDKYNFPDVDLEEIDFEYV